MHYDVKSAVFFAWKACSISESPIVLMRIATSRIEEAIRLWRAPANSLVTLEDIRGVLRGILKMCRDDTNPFSCCRIHDEWAAHASASMYRVVRTLRPYRPANNSESIARRFWSSSCIFPLCSKMNGCNTSLRYFFGEINTSNMLPGGRDRSLVHAYVLGKCAVLPSRWDVEAMIAGLKSNRALGPDGIPPFLWICCSSGLCALCSPNLL